MRRSPPVLNEILPSERELIGQMYCEWFVQQTVQATMDLETAKQRELYNIDLLQYAEEVELSVGLAGQFAAYKELVTGSEYYEANERFLADCREPLIDLFGSVSGGDGALAEAGVDMVVVVNDGMSVHRWFSRDDSEFLLKPEYWTRGIVRLLRSVPVLGNFALKIDGPRYGGFVDRAAHGRFDYIDDKTINPQWLKSGHWLVNDAVLGSAIRRGQADLVLVNKTMTSEIVNQDIGTFIPRKPVFTLPIKSNDTGGCGNCSIRTCRHGSWGDIAQFSEEIVSEVLSQLVDLGETALGGATIVVIKDC